MPAPAAERRDVWFGQYQVDFQAGEVRNSHVKVRLQEKPFQILAILLEHPGGLVTREELRQRLWPGDTFVDFEHGINVAMRKLREALGDSAEEPRFIETLPRRGYRFIAPLESNSRAPLPAVHHEAVGTEISRSEAAGVPAPGGRPQGTPRRGGWIIAAASGAVVVAMGIMFALNVGELRERTRVAVGAQDLAPLPRIDSLAVLPLENLSRDPEQEYFADGLTDALITDLGKISTLRVISRASVIRYKRGVTPLPQIGRELNVDAVVEGTVCRSGDRVRITAQLLEVRTDRHLWAETYERDAEDVIQMEKQAALAIAHEISGQLTPAQETRLAGGRTPNPRAFDAYLRGRYLWNRRIEEPTAEAVGYFEQSLREDPKFALAYSGLADCYSAGWWSKADVPVGEKYAREAVAREPDLAEGHASLGIVEVYQHKFPEGKKELQRAIELNPNYATAHHWLGLYWIALGHLTEALAENDRARQLDPFSLPVNYLRGDMMLGLHEYGRAEEQYTVAAAINPQSASPRTRLARIAWLQGKVSEAVAEETKAVALLHTPAFFHDHEEVAAVYKRAGLRAAQLRSAQLREKGYYRTERCTLPCPDGYEAFSIALQYALFGDREKALSWLNQAAQDPWTDSVVDLSTAPELDFLRSDPRFQALLRRMNIPP